MRVSLLDGTTQFVNAGHPWPLLLRQERVEEVVPEVDLPFGIQLRRPGPSGGNSRDHQPESGCCAPGEDHVSAEPGGLLLGGVRIRNDLGEDLAQDVLGAQRSVLGLVLWRGLCIPGLCRVVCGPR
ncbi:SpoIIE family protein phosphatase [Streptomyces sp. NBC_00597]